VYGLSKTLKCYATNRITYTEVSHDASHCSAKLYLVMNFVFTKVNMVLGDKIGASVLMVFRDMKSTSLVYSVKKKLAKIRHCLTMNSSWRIQRMKTKRNWGMNSP
jgi:hypothetical protein